MTCTSESPEHSEVSQRKKNLLSENISDAKEQNQWRDMKKVFQAVQSGEIKMCKLEWGDRVRWKSNKQASGSRASALRDDQETGLGGMRVLVTDAVNLDLIPQAIMWA